MIEDLEAQINRAATDVPLSKKIAATIGQIKKLKAYDSKVMMKLLGVGRSKYYRMYSGSHDFKLSELEKICKVLNISLLNLIKGVVK